MKQLAKVFGIGLLVVCIVMMVSGVSLAGSGSPEKPTPTAPYGVVMQGDAKGVKLYGSISVEYTGYKQCDTGSCADTGRAVLQLQTSKGNLIKTWVRDVVDLPYDPQAQVDALIAAFTDDILDTFFGGENLNVVLVSLGEYQITPDGVDPNYMIASITLAVN